MQVQWYPGHMAKTRRMIVEQLKLIDLAVEILDARIPVSSRNPDLDSMLGSKPRLIVLNRSDQADGQMNRRWAEWFRGQGYQVLLTDCRSGAGVSQFAPTVRAALREQIARWVEKGQVGRPIRVMVAGVPNVGKSTFINQVSGRKSAKAQNRPGVTRGKQWITVAAWSFWTRRASSGPSLRTPPWGCIWPILAR